MPPSLGTWVLRLADVTTIGFGQVTFRLFSEYFKMATQNDDEFEREVDRLHQEKDRYWETPAGNVSQEEKERDYQEWLDAIAKGAPKAGESDAPRDPVYRYNAEAAMQQLLDSLNRQFVYQEMHVRKHHPDWTEAQILKHLEKLRAQTLEGTFAPRPLTTVNKKRRRR